MIDHLGTYGTPAMVRIHDEPQIKYPTEVKAAAHIYNPDNEQFIPAPVGPLRVWCCGCRGLKAADSFHRHTKRSGGYQAFCKTCQKAHRKAKRLKQPDLAGHWYRETNVSQVPPLHKKVC